MKKTNALFLGPDRQTTADFLTSMTSPQERRVRPGCEKTVPRTPEEFARRWKESEERDTLVAAIDRYEEEHPSQERFDQFTESRKAERSSALRLQSPYTISYLEQVRLCLSRGVKRLVADPAFPIFGLSFNLIMGLVLGSAFYNLPNSTDSFYHRGGVMFFTLLFNAFASELEVLTLYSQRPVIEKHARYAFYHQSAEAISSYFMDFPYKITNAIVFNTIIYFLVHLRREAGAYFFFVLTSFLLTLTMSGIYRTIASITRTSHQALVPVSLITIGVMVYTGFTIPTDYMPGWSRWMGYINPLGYGFEALMANEFHGRFFPCTEIVPSGGSYDELPMSSRLCTSVGATAGATTVSGDLYIKLNYGYYNSHKWRYV